MDRLVCDIKGKLVGVEKFTSKKGTVLYRHDILQVSGRGASLVSVLSYHNSRKVGDDVVITSRVSAGQRGLVAFELENA